MKRDNASPHDVRLQSVAWLLPDQAGGWGWHSGQNAITLMHEDIYSIYRDQARLPALRGGYTGG